MGLFGDRTDTLANCANILVCIAGCAVDPSGLTLAGTATNTTLSLNAIFKASSKDAKALVAELASDMERRLAHPDFHMPENGRVMLPQMVELALPSPSDLTGSNLDPDAILGLMLDKLTYPEHRRADMVEAFCNFLRPSLTRLLNDQTFVATLGPQIARETLTRMQDIADGLVTLSRTYQTLAKSLDHLGSLRRKELEALAYRFGLNPAPLTSAEDLVGLLELKAQDARAYQLQIADINESVAALHNLKKAAQDAASRLDFAEVETLLSRVDEVETEAAAQTKELRAANALLQGRVDDAHRLYAAAADSFASIGPLEPARRRNAHAAALHNHGLRYGGPGLSHAITLWRKTLTEVPLSTDPDLWAGTQNNLAVALGNQATRVEGAVGADLLAQAVAAYRAALTVNTNADQPLEWAVTQNNLATALQTQAARVEGAAGADLLAQAVAAYRDALTVYTKDDHPLDWAMTQNNLAVALGNQATRVEGAVGADLLAQTVAAYREALTVRTKADHPVNWAGTKNNLANALANQAARDEGAAGADLLAQAVAAYRDALTVRTKADHPLDWAMTQNNLAVALKTQAEWVEGAVGADLLAQAVAAYRDALTVYTKADHPLQWAMTKENLAIAELGMARHGSTSDPIPHLQVALNHAEAALTVFDPIHTAPNFAKAARLRDALTDMLSILNP